MTLLDEFGHITIEEGHEQSVDMRTVHVGIGHDDNLIITELLIIGFLAVLAQTKAYTQSLDDIVHLLMLESLVPHHALHIEDLTANGQDGLELTLSALLGRTACGVTLHDEEFAVGRITVRAVGQFAGKTTATHWTLALYALTGFACSHTCRGSQYHLVHDKFGLTGMFLQIGGESLTHSLLHGSCHLAVAQLGLGLSFKLRFGHLDGDNGSESLAEVLTTDFHLVLDQLLQFLHTLLLGIGLQSAGESGTEALQMGSTLYGIDIVDIGMEILAVSCVVHDGHLDGHTLLLCAEIDDIIKEMSTTAVHEANEVAQASLAVIFLCAGSTLLIGTKVGQCDGDTGIQISQLAHTVGQHIEIIGGGGEDAPIGPELLTCATQVRLAHHLHGIESLATGIFLLIDLSITEHLGEHMGGEGIHTTDTHTMETAAHLITALVELTAGMQNGHHHLKGTSFSWMSTGIPRPLS